MDEGTKLINEGLKDEDVSLSIEFLNCDTPAKAFVLYLKGHAGYDSCTKRDINVIYARDEPEQENKEVTEEKDR